MDKTTEFPAGSVLNIRKEIQINAPAAIVFESILDQMGPGGTMENGQPMNMRLEPWPGGRWFRDLGNNTGHLWGHVQVIKPPTLIEITGPMFMSYPVMSHFQYRVTEKGGTSTLTLSHRAIGDIAPEHRDGVTKGWQHIVEQIKRRSER